MLLQFPEMLVPGILESMQLEQQAAYVSLGPLVRDTALWALTLTNSDFKPGPTSSVQFSLVATNTTLWCGVSGADAAPAIRHSQQLSFARAQPYHEVLAAGELAVVWMNSTAAQGGDAAAAAPAETPAEGGFRGAVGTVTEPAAEPDAAAPGADGAARDGGGVAQDVPSRAAAEGQPVQASGAAAAAPAAIVTVGGGGASEPAWLVPFLSVLVVGAHPR